MALPLASAQNYLAGVQVRALSLAGVPHPSEEASAQILAGITQAIRLLHDAASIIESSRRGDSSGAFTVAELGVTDDLLRLWLAPSSRD